MKVAAAQVHVSIALALAVAPTIVSAAPEASSRVELQPMTKSAATHLAPGGGLTSTARVLTNRGESMAQPAAVLDAVRARYAALVAGMRGRSDQPGAVEDLASELRAAAWQRRAATTALLEG